MTGIFTNPLRFGASGDFADPETEEGAFQAEVEMVVMTRKRAGKVRGELPWDQQFGSRVEYYRHERANMDPVEITTELQEAFQKYLAAGRVRSVTTAVEDGALKITILYGRDQSLTLTVPAGSW